MLSRRSESPPSSAPLPRPPSSTFSPTSSPLRPPNPGRRSGRPSSSLRHRHRRFCSSSRRSRRERCRGDLRAPSWTSWCWSTHRECWETNRLACMLRSSRLSVAFSFDLVRPSSLSFPQALLTFCARRTLHLPFDSRRDPRPRHEPPRIPHPPIPLPHPSQLCPPHSSHHYPRRLHPHACKRAETPRHWDRRHRGL